MAGPYSADWRMLTVAGLGSVIDADWVACSTMDRALPVTAGLFRLGRTPPNNFPLVSAGKALSIRIAQCLHAATQDCLTPLRFLEQLVAGVAVVDVHPLLLFAFRTAVEITHAANAR
jgi:hypothetical protein